VTFSLGFARHLSKLQPKVLIKRDTQLINGRLVLVWHTDEKIKIWDVEKEELLHTVDGPDGLQDIKIAEDGSRVFSIGARVDSSTLYSNWKDCGQSRDQVSKI
jgi:hypothetical protein